MSNETTPKANVNKYKTPNNNNLKLCSDLYAIRYLFITNRKGGCWAISFEYSAPKTNVVFLDSLSD